MFKKINVLMLLSIFFSLVFLSCSSNISNPGEAGDPFVELTYPNGYQTLQLGAPYSIIWRDNLVENINIQLYRGANILVKQYNDIPSIGQYQITIPFDISTGSDYKIKVVSVQNSNIKDESDFYFEVIDYVSDGNDSPGSATLINYIHSGNYAIYTEGDIDWYKVYLEAGYTYYFENSSESDFDTDFYLYGPDNPYGVEVAYDDDGVLGTQQPKIEYYVNESGDYYLRVAYRYTKSKADKLLTTGYYTLNVNGDWTGEIIVTSPNGGEEWVMGTGENIIWVDNSGNYIDIDLYKSGSYYTNIASSIYNAGSYYWDIPTYLEADTDYQIVVSNAEDTSMYDESDYYFSIFESYPAK